MALTRSGWLAAIAAGVVVAGASLYVYNRPPSDTTHEQAQDNSLPPGQPSTIGSPSAPHDEATSSTEPIPMPQASTHLQTFPIVGPGSIGIYLNLQSKIINKRAGGNTYHTNVFKANGKEVLFDGSCTNACDQYTGSTRYLACTNSGCLGTYPDLNIATGHVQQVINAGSMRDTAACYSATVLKKFGLICK